MNGDQTIAEIIGWKQAEPLAVIGQDGLELEVAMWRRPDGVLVSGWTTDDLLAWLRSKFDDVSVEGWSSTDPDGEHHYSVNVTCFVGNEPKGIDVLEDTLRAALGAAVMAAEGGR